MKKSTWALTFIVLSPTFLFAHGSHGSGFMAGFTHPIFGIDHNLAILGTGILGYYLDKKRWYMFPLSFILLMIVGGAIGIGREATTTIEKVIALSVLLIGGGLSFRINPGIIVFALLAGIGFFHGYAHGAEMPDGTSPVKYISGFTSGAMLLSLLGWFISRFLGKMNDSDQSYRLLGAFLVGCGFMLLLS